MSLDSAGQEAEEQRKKRFEKLLESRDYNLALKLAEKMPSPTVCYYVSYHIDRLIPAKKIEEAKKVARLFGRCLDVYLLHTYGMACEDKPYKPKRRS